MAFSNGSETSQDRRIFRLAVPNLVANLSFPFVGIVDTALVGHLPNVAFMGAVAVASVIFDVVYAGFGFLRMGTTSLASHYHGAGNRRRCAEILCLAGLLGLGLGLATVLLRDGIVALGFDLAGPSEAVQLWGKRYFAIRVYAAPLVLLSFVLIGFFRGLADVVTPMWMTLITTVLNVVGDYALIYGKWGAPALGVEGAAWASVLAVLAGLLYGCGVLAWRYRDYLTFRVGDRKQVRRLLATNLDLLGRTACLLFAQLFVVAIVGRLGETALAANAILWQVWFLASNSVDAVAYAAETLVGNHLGARRFLKARQISGRCLFWGAAIGLGYACVYGSAMAPIASGFTRHDAVADLVVSLTFWVAAAQPLNGVAYVFDGIFIGANDTRRLFLAMVLSAFAVFLPVTLLLVYGMDLGIEGAWVGYNALMVGRVATLYVRYRSDGWLKTLADASG